MDIKVDNKVVDPKLVTLHDGYVTKINEKEVPYKRVILRPPCLGFDEQAIILAERLIMISGVPTLKMSEEIHKIAMTMLRIERFECTDSNIDPIDSTLIDLTMMRKIHPLDFIKIEMGVVLFDMVEALRFGNITQKQFDDFYNPTVPNEPNTPQLEGETGGTEKLVQKPHRARPIVSRLDK